MDTWQIQSFVSIFPLLEDDIPGLKHHLYEEMDGMHKLVYYTTKRLHDIFGGEKDDPSVVKCYKEVETILLSTLSDYPDWSSRFSIK